jgi:hypothetical protein
LKTDGRDEALARRALLEQAGVATVEELRVKKRWGRTRSVSACIRIHSDADAREVCRRAAQALVERLRDGSLALDAPGLAEHLRQTVVDQVAIDQPNYSGLATALEHH